MNKALTAERCVYLSTRFYEHPFIQSLMKEFSVKGLSLAIAILTEIGRYGTEACFGRKFRKCIVGLIPNVSVNLIKMVVRRMVEAGFLDKKVFDERKVLTPPSSYIVYSRLEVYDGTVDSSAPYYFVRDGYFAKKSEESRHNSELSRNNTELFGTIPE